jgi:hypothetical protein
MLGIGEERRLRYLRELSSEEVKKIINHGNSYLDWRNLWRKFKVFLKNRKLKRRGDIYGNTEGS